MHKLKIRSIVQGVKYMYTIQSPAIQRLRLSLGYLIIAIGVCCGVYADIRWHMLIIDAIWQGLGK
jgi:uncharacterized membrane protein YidH (DUF202 family)